MREMYKAVKRVLTELVDGQGSPVFNTVDLDKGQMDRLLGGENSEGLVFFPAVFIRFNNIRYEPYMEGVKRGSAEMSCRIVLSDPLGVTDDAIFDYREWLDRTLMDARQTEEFMAIMGHVYEDMPPSYDNTIEWMAVYDVAFLDTGSWRYRNFLDSSDLEQYPNGPLELDIQGGMK